MKKMLKSTIYGILSLTCACSLLHAQKITPIEIPKGNFEDEESVFGMEPVVSSGNTWAAWEFTDKSWGLAEPQDVGEGECSVVLSGPATLTLDIPKGLRGQSIELTFIGKGDASFAAYGGNDMNYINPLTVKNGKIVKGNEKEDRLYSIYTNFKGNRNYPKYTSFKVLFPPLPEDANRIAITLNQNNPDRPYILQKPRRFFIDKVQARANSQRFYRLAKPEDWNGVPYDLNRFEPGGTLLGSWTFEKDKILLSKDEKSRKNVLALKKDAKLTLPLSLSELKGKSIEVAFRARGKGELTVNMNAGTAGELKRSFQSPSRLSADMMKQLIWFCEVPDYADKLELQISANDVAELEDIRLRVSRTPLVPFPANLPMIPGEQLPPDYLEGRRPSHEGFVNIAPYAEIASEEFKIRPRDMVDGSLGSRGDGITTFRFEKPQKISELRLTLPQPTILIYADVTGNGKYDTPLVEELTGLKFSTWGNLQEYVWYRKVLEQPLSVHGIKYIGSANEFQILARTDDARELLKEKAFPKLSEAPLLTTNGAEISVPETKPEDRLYYGFTLEPWMFDVPGIVSDYFKKNAPMPPVEEWKQWQKLLADFKSIKANFILLFPPHTLTMPPGAKPRKNVPYPAPVMWDSSVWYLNQPLNLLKEMNRSCKENGILNFVIPREWLFKNEQPDEQIIFAREIAEQNSDGIPVCVDEHQIGTGCTLPAPVELTQTSTAAQKEKAAAVQAEADAFKKRFGVDAIPLKQADDKLTRMGHLWKLEKIAQWMASIKSVSAAVKPDSLTFGGFAGCDHYKDRFAVVSGHDAWGFEGRCDVIGGDGTYFGVGDAPYATYTPYVASAVQVACSAKRLSMATNNVNWGINWDEKNKKLINPLVNDDYPATAYYGGALATYFAKGTYLNFWRYNYMDLRGPETRKAITRGGHMTDTLSAWGGKKAQIPKDVLILRSRPSEDWWNLKQKFANTANTDKKAESNDKWWIIDDDKSTVNTSARCQQGFTQFFWTTAQLCEHAVPFEIYMMNRPEAWKDIAAQYKVIILPFPYAVAKEEFEALKKAVDAGVKVIALGGAGMGPVDWIGEPYEKPILEELINAGKIHYFDMDVINQPNSGKLREDFKKLLFESLGPEGPSLTLEKEKDHDVQAYLLEVSKTEKLVLIVNWSERDTEINLGLNMPSGNYRMMSRNLDNTTGTKINGKDVFTEKELKKFRMKLPKEDAKILRIYHE